VSSSLGGDFRSSPRLARQFDEVIWFDETTAVEPLGEDGGSSNGREMPDTYPFGR